jgi:glycosyltransferase involved in cell wall biosynthesis
MRIRQFSGWQIQCAVEQSGSEHTSVAKKPQLTVAVPVYNELATLLEIHKRILSVPLDIEILYVDDGSTDGSREILMDQIAGSDERVRVVLHDVNQGKGAAIMTAIKHAAGELFIVQDADLEYEPLDYLQLVKVFDAPDVQVVYGSRFLNRRHPEHMKLTNWLANRILTITTNVLIPGAHITDEATCYKVFRTEMLKLVPLHARRFDFCPEITMKVLRRGHSIHEVPISYTARTEAQGKKIKWTDAFDAFSALLRYRFSADY